MLLAGSNYNQAHLHRSGVSDSSTWVTIWMSANDLTLAIEYTRKVYSIFKENKNHNKLRKIHNSMDDIKQVAIRAGIFKNILSILTSLH